MLVMIPCSLGQDGVIPPFVLLYAFLFRHSTRGCHKCSTEHPSSLILRLVHWSTFMPVDSTTTMIVLSYLFSCFTDK
jgi:hypothetical protein